MDDGDVTKQSPLRQMLGYLCDNRTPQRVASRSITHGFRHQRKAPPYLRRQITSIAQLAAALGYRNHSSLYPQKQRLAPDTGDAIRNLYDINDQGSCWRCFWEGEAELFAREYEKLHALETFEQLAEAVARNSPSANTALVELQWDAYFESRSTATRYAFLNLRTGNSPPDQDPGRANIGFDLHCPEDRTDTLTTGLKRCFLIFDCGGGHTGPLAARTGNGSGIEFDSVRISTFGTSRSAPAWELTAIGQGVIGKVESIPSTFVEIDNLQPGCIISAKIRAPVKEVQTTFVMPEAPLADVSAAKRRIKARLHQLGIVGGEDGEADFATSEIRMIQKASPAISRGKR